MWKTKDDLKPLLIPEQPQSDAKTGGAVKVSGRYYTNSITDNPYTLVAKPNLRDKIYALSSKVKSNCNIL